MHIYILHFFFEKVYCTYPPYFFDRPGAVLLILTALGRSGFKKINKCLNIFHFARNLSAL
jgi:hypothetical protein